MPGAEQSAHCRAPLAVRRKLRVPGTCSRYRKPDLVVGRGRGQNDLNDGQNGRGTDSRPEAEQRHAAEHPGGQRKRAGVDGGVQTELNGAGTQRTTSGTAGEDGTETDSCEQRERSENDHEAHDEGEQRSTEAAEDAAFEAHEAERGEGEHDEQRGGDETEKEHGIAFLACL